MRSETRQRLYHALLWAVLVAPVVAGQTLPPRDPGWQFLVLAGLATMGLAVGSVVGPVTGPVTGPARRWPLVGLVIVIAASTVDGNFSFSIPVFSYLAGRHTAKAWPAAVVFGLIATAGSAVSIGVFGTAPGTWFVLVTTLLFAGVFPWLVGRYRRQHHELVSLGWQRADQLERERGMVAAQAQLRERARIARDMHDSLGHELSLLALRAGALELAASPQSEAAARAQSEAAAQVRASAVAATERLREIIGVMRDDGVPAPLTPRDESVAALVGRAKESGLVVNLVADDLPEHVERIAYGIVQEALTNAARHAPGAPVSVEITTSGNGTTVCVSNPVASDTTIVEGFGLAGLRERVRLAGGTINVGIRSGAYLVTSHVPHDQARGPRPERPPTQRTAQRKVRRSLVTAVAAPAAIAAVVSLTYYPVASFGSVLETDAFDRMQIGQPRSDLALPKRQALDPPSRASPVGMRCEFYSDGNFPMANASFRLCFRDGVLASKEKL